MAIRKITELSNGKKQERRRRRLKVKRLNKE